jgi:hypothetical protein
MSTAEQVAWIRTVLNVEVPMDGNGKDGGKGGIKDKIKALFAKKPKPKPVAPIPRADLGKPQQDRADKLLGDMSKDDKEKVQKVLTSATPEAKKYLTKAIANKHSAAEIEAFAKKIAGKNQAWMDENLHLVGLSQGKGIKQQWHDSCGPTTIQAMTGELDPIYALKLHEENTDMTSVDNTEATKINPKMAEEQRAELEGHGGVAASRSKDTGKGMGLKGILGEQKDKTGLQFENIDLEAGDLDAQMTKGLDEAQKSLKAGLPVPVRVGNGGAGGHFVLMTGVDDGPPRRYSFHDPWEGKTDIFSEEQIKSGKLNIAGWTNLTDVFNPSMAP